MKHMVENNIDFLTAKCGFQIVENLKKPLEAGNKSTKIETIINNSLGVLSSNGVYALWLYVKSENNENNIKIVNILNDCGIELNGGSDEDKVINLSKDLKKLLFAKEILEKTLIYARYRAKAESSMEKGESKKENPPEELKEISNKTKEG